MEKSAEASQSDGTLRQQTSPKCIKRSCELMVQMIYDPTIHTRKEWKSNTYGFRFGILLEHQKETGQVVCNAENCNRILNRTSFVGLQAHIRLHVSVPSSEKEFSNSLMEFVICSTQSFNVVANCKSISCLDAFQSLVIEKLQKRMLKASCGLLAIAENSQQSTR